MRGRQEEEFSSPGAEGAMKDQEAHYLGTYALDSLTQNQKRLFIPLSFPRSLPSSWQVIHALIRQMEKLMLRVREGALYQQLDSGTGCVSVGWDKVLSTVFGPP